MITVRSAEERGHTQLAWLDSRHTFSFDRYYAPRHMGFRALRVINDDRVAPGQGFATHSHRDMEILTYVLEGTLAHEDNLGNRFVIRRGEMQRMTAGTGIAHSEFNASPTDPVHFLQIWIQPDRAGLPPGYEQRSFPIEKGHDKLRLMASCDGRDASVTVHQDADVFVVRLGPGDGVVHRPRRGRQLWVQVAHGATTLNGVPLAAGDGAAVIDEDAIRLEANQATEILVFDLA